MGSVSSKSNAFVLSAITAVNMLSNWSASGLNGLSISLVLSVIVRFANKRFTFFVSSFCEEMNCRNVSTFWVCSDSEQTTPSNVATLQHLDSYCSIVGKTPIAFRRSYRKRRPNCVHTVVMLLWILPSLPM